MMGIRLLSLGIVFVLSPTVAAAQTRTFDGEITSGSIVIDISGFSHHVAWDISGTGFRIIGSASDIYRVDACPFADGSCVAGSTVSLHAEVGQEQFGDGIAIVNGETLSPAYFLGGFYLPGGTATIPTKGNRKVVK